MTRPYISKGGSMSARLARLEREYARQQREKKKAKAALENQKRITSK
jgi:hypothetical protein